MIEIIRNKVLMNLYQVKKDGVPVFSYKDYGDRLMIIPYCKHFSSTNHFMINKNKLEELVKSIKI